MKNRTVLGVICIVLAVAITFVISPMVNKAAEGKTKVVCFAHDISQGSEINEDDIEIVELTKNMLPEKYLTEKEKIIGKFANSDLYKGDVATEKKFTDNANSSVNVLSALSGDKVAMSITIQSFADGFSGKIQNGDIISICVTNKKGETTIPAELKYVKVITTTTKGGVDESEVIPNEDGTFDLPTTVTVLVTAKQAVILANYEKNAEMHIVLVYRGDEKSSQKFIEYQDDVLNNDKGGANNG